MSTLKDTSLITSVIDGNFEFTKLLIGSGANLNARDCNNNTAIIIATNYNKPNIVKILIDAGADLDVCGVNGTAIVVASYFDNIGTVKMLFDAGADITIVDDNNDTACTIAKKKKFKSIVELLNTFEKVSKTKNK